MTRSNTSTRYPTPDMNEIKGMEDLKSALESAACRRQNLLVIGPPGSGSTMGARRVPTILPEMSETEITEVTTTYAIAGALPADCGDRVESRPFRAPHYTISGAGLFGTVRRQADGIHVRPGELALAQHGCLLLDEITEFSPRDLEILAASVQTGRVDVGLGYRHDYPQPAVPATPGRPHASWPVDDVMVVGHALPCYCGYRGSERCTCSPAALAAYDQRLTEIRDSGLFGAEVSIEPETAAVICRDGATGDSSATIRARVTAWRAECDHRAAGLAADETDEARDPVLVARERRAADALIALVDEVEAERRQADRSRAAIEGPAPTAAEILAEINRDAAGR